MACSQIDGSTFAGMVAGGAANLRLHATEVNDLNVFPIPDGDTGDNMLMTIEGGANAASKHSGGTLSSTAAKLKEGMLLSARGNSGVILSQFFAGIADGFDGMEEADVNAMKSAFRNGVERAYGAVMTPTEGTILTVVRDATDAVCASDCSTVEEFFACFIKEAKDSLDRTPELLDVLKEADVVDSGGAGLVYITEGMYQYIRGDAAPAPSQAETVPAAPVHSIDPSLFTEDSVLEFGYCTELLLRLQTIKTDPESFDISVIRDYLESIGNSIVAVKSGSIVKIHVHTMEPYRVLQFCQQYGEYLTVKIENMMIQHNEIVERRENEESESLLTPEVSAQKPRQKHKKHAIVAVASGEGIKNAFLEFGADEVINGGQTMNPSADDFLKAIEYVNADNVFLLPNNSNIIMAARQAAEMCSEAEVRVIPTKTIGDAYAVLGMYDPSGSADEIAETMTEAMQGVETAEISCCIRDAHIDGVSVSKGDYIGIRGKEVLAAGSDLKRVVTETAAGLDPESHALLLLIRGEGSSEEEAEAITADLKSHWPLTDICSSDGGQSVYNYIIVAE